MDRKGIIAVVLAFLIMVTYPFIEAKYFPPPKVAPTPAPSASTAPGNASFADVANAPAGAPVVPEKVLPEEKQVVRTPAVEFTFTNHGGGIATAELLNHKVDQSPNSKNVLLNAYGSTPIGAISDLPGENADVSYTSGTDAQGVVTYERTTAQQIQVSKKYTLPSATSTGPDQYTATLEITFTNLGDASYRDRGYYISLGSGAPIHEKDQQRFIAFDSYRNGSDSQIAVTWFNASTLFWVYQLHPEKTVYETDDGNIKWAAVSGQYFATIITSMDAMGQRAWSTRFPLDLTTGEKGADWTKNHPDATPSLYGINGAFQMPAFNVAPRQSVTQKFQIYLGPKQYQVLKKMGEGQSEILHLGYSGFINKFLLRMMNLLVSKLKVSYAVAIIILTVTIKLLLWPLQNKSTQSMKKMQALSPKMKEIQEKYKDDPARMNQENMKLYKTYGVNPLAGCLPMFIQLPVFVGFYSMLGSAIELRNSQFFWVHDLSQPDNFAHPFGVPINLLPLCMAASSVWMMAITPKAGDSSQQKMMMFMPLMFLYICYSYASGLALYMMVSNLFSIVQLQVTKNQTPPTLEKMTAAVKKRR